MPLMTARPMAITGPATSSAVCLSAPALGITAITDAATMAAHTATTVNEADMVTGVDTGAATATGADTGIAGETATRTTTGTAVLLPAIAVAAMAEATTGAGFAETAGAGC